MSGRQWLPGPPLRSFLRKRSARFRLTALYCCLFLPSGVLLVAVTYVLIVLVRLDQVPSRIVPTISTALRRATTHGSPLASGPVPRRTSNGGLLGHAAVSLPGHIILDAREFLVGSGIVLAAMIGLSVLLGWLVAGRVLRPLRVMTAAARQISERNLNERLALAGPDDELKYLGDTIDSLLARLEAAFDAQRRFVANASHELRTPLMLSQTILQVALADPEMTVGSLQAACQEAIEAGKEQARLIDALLVLARSQRGLDHREAVDLGSVVRDALKAHASSAAAKGLQVNAAVDHAEVPGDSRLIYRMASNLVDNAIRYNTTGGRVDVTVAATGAGSTLSVTNTGPPVPPDQIGRLLEPFQRAAPDRMVSTDGLGLGLSIVSDIAKAHGAGLDVRPQPGGGLSVVVNFPVEARPAPDGDRDQARPAMARPGHSR